MFWLENKKLVFNYLPLSNGLIFKKQKTKKQFFLFLKQAKHILWELKRTETVLLSPSTYVKTDKLENFKFYTQSVCLSRPLNKRLDSSIGNMFSSN